MIISRAYLDAHEENFADQYNNSVVVGILMQTANSKDVLFNNWEENFNQLVQGLPFLVNFKFKRLDQAF